MEPIVEMSPELWQRASDFDWQFIGLRPGDRLACLDHHQGIRGPVRDVRNPDPVDPLEKGTLTDETSVEGLMAWLYAEACRCVDLGHIA